MVPEPDDRTGMQSWVDQPVADIGEVLQALADPIRLSIVRALADSDGELACGMFDLPVGKPTLSHHFRVLREAGLIASRMEGTRKLIRLRRDDIDAAHPHLVDAVLGSGRVAATPG